MGSLRRSIDSQQLRMRMVFGYFDGTVGAPAADGPDKHRFSVTKVGTGEYTVIVDEGFEQDVHPVSLLPKQTSVESVRVKAVDTDRFTMELLDNTDTPIDSEVWFTLVGSDNPDKF